MKSFLNHKAYIAAEFFILCILIPGIIIYFTLAPVMFSFLYGAALYGFLILRKTDDRTLSEIWKWEAVTWANMKPMLIRFCFGAVGMFLFLLWYDPDRLFNLLERAPAFIPVLMVAYPVLSALPQELVFCTFFFARYAPFFGTGRLMILASAIIFAYAHILYINPVAPFLSFFGGLIFALTYARTKSLALVTIEHGLYGNALFLIGLGYYFYSGSVVNG